MARTDIVVYGAGVSLANRNCAQSNRPIWTAAGTWYHVFIDFNTADVAYTKTTNSGLSWSVPVLIKSSALVGLAVWFDKWTPGDSGTLIHIAYFDGAGTHDVFYRSLDTASDTLGTEITAATITSSVGGANSCISITKSRGPRILIGFDVDGGTETGFVKSDDYPVTAFSAMDNGLQEGTSDYFILLPGNYADTNDIDAIYWDRSADEISLKTYDDSADNWTGVSAETSIAGTMVDLASTTASPQFAAAVRNSDGHAIVVAWSAADAANADLRLWDINGAASITEQTPVVSNGTDDQALCGVGIDSTNDKIFVFYSGKSDGTETFNTLMNVYYKTSTDGGANWGSETRLTELTRPVSYLYTSLEFGTADEFVVVWGGVPALATLCIDMWTAAQLPAGGSGGNANILRGSVVA